MEVHPDFETKSLAQCEEGELVLIKIDEDIRLCVLIQKENPRKGLLLILDNFEGPLLKEYRNSLDCISYRKDFKIILLQDNSSIRHSERTIRGAIGVSVRGSDSCIYIGLKDDAVMIHPEVKFGINRDNWWFLEWRLVVPKLNEYEETTLFSFKAQG